MKNPIAVTPSPDAHSAHCAHAACCATDTHAAAPPPVSLPLAAGAQVFHIPAMDCVAEEGEIRHALAGMAGIRSLNFQLGARTLAIDADEDALAPALQAIRQAGFQATPLSAAATADARKGWLAEGLPRYAIALSLATAAELMDYFAPPTMAFEGLGMLLAAAAIWMAGLSTYAKGLAALRHGRLNINALMTVAVTGAFLIGQWPEAAMVMALYAIAEMIEARSVDRARNAIQGLMALAPDEALTLQADGQWRSLAVADVALGATVRVAPGGRIPMDGVVTRGASAVNQASVTGESIPVDKGEGDSVFAGTISETGELELRVTAAAVNSTLARIIHAVEQAQGSRAPTQKFVDRFAAIYTPGVFAIALLVAVLPPLLLDWTWMQAVYKALVLLVIACPCALVISTPVTVVSGLAAAARRGILIKGGTYLEDARRIRAVALDKTGTITVGKPSLVDWQAWNGQAPDAVLQIAASLATRSDHPISKAIAAGLTQAAHPVHAFQALPGRGIQGEVAGQPYVLGNHRLIEERAQCSPELEQLLSRHESQGRSVTLLAGPNGVLGVFAVADTIKASARQAIAELRALGVAPVLLSGDNAQTAKAIGALAGIDDARGDLLPEDKLTALKDLHRRYGATAMVGDGINDAPALAQADIGFAMGGAGTDIAMEAADIVIMNDELARVPETIRLSRRTHAILWQNISVALGIKGVFLVLAVWGSASMWMAVFADMGASLLVVANGLRLLRR